jgi:hypothetical protein
MDGRCATCRWWTVPAVHRPDWGRCDLTESGNGLPAVTDSAAMAYDGETWSAILETAPEFGCNQHEPKDGA